MSLVKKKKGAVVAAPSNYNNEQIQINEDVVNNNRVTNVLNLELNVNQKITRKNPVISICGKRIATTNNCVVIAGKPKARKSVVMHSILASAISGKSILNIESNIPEDSLCVLIDTEQSIEDLSVSLERVKRMARIDNFPTTFKCYSFRSLNSDEIKTSIEELILYHKNIKLIAIDGGLDLVSNMNDVEESKRTIDWIKKILTNNDICLAFVLHQSKSTNYTIGHLGSFLDRFAQGVIEVTKLDNGNSQIKPMMLRSDGDFDAFEFGYNNNSHLYEVDNAPKFSKISDPSELSREEHITILERIFSSNKEMTYVELKKELSRAYEKSERFAIKLTKHFFNLGILEKSEKEQIRFRY